MQEFIKKVFEMRKLQKSFYRSKDRNILMAAKAAEYEVDVELEHLGLSVNEKPKKDKAKPNNNPQLF